MSPPAETSARARFWHVAWLVLGLTPVALMLITVLRLWLPLPYWDEWSTPGENLYNLARGQLTFTELFSQHNESRKLFPRLLYLSLAQLGGWDVRKEMALTFLIVCAIAFCFYRILRQIPGATARGALLAGIAGSFLCFSPVQLENFLWGVQLEVFFPGLAVLLLAIVNLSTLSLARKAFLNGLLSFVVTFTVAHGMLLWLLGFPLSLGPRSPTSARRRWLIYGAYLLCAAAAIAAYLIGYQRPPHHPVFLSGHPGVLTLAHYLILWVGSYFTSTLTNPFAVGLAVSALFLAVLVVSLRLSWKHGAWRTFYPGLLIAFYACASAAITAIGRIGFGVQQALDTRYRTYSLFLYLALVALLFALFCFRSGTMTSARLRSWQRGFIALALVALLGWLVCYRDSFSQQELLSRRNLSLLRALEWIHVIPDNPTLLTLFPKPEHLRSRARFLHQNKVLRLPFITERLADQVQKTPRPLNGQPYGQIETCFFDPAHQLVITGRAELPHLHQPPDCIVIGAVDTNGIYKPVSILETRRPRGGGKTTASPSERPLFSGTIHPANLPPGDLSIAAWAVDLQSEKVYPLAGVTFIPADKR